MSKSKQPVVEIDLTLSESEPEEPPRHHPRPNAHHQPNAHRQPLFTNPDRSQSSRVTMEQRRSQGSTQIPTMNPPPINPDQMAQLIKTTDAEHLQRVVLELCLLSPALSGAVARGVAAHSTYARSLIDRQGQAARPNIKAEHNQSRGGSGVSTRLPSPKPSPGHRYASLKTEPNSPAYSTSGSSNVSSTTQSHGSIPGAFPRTPSANQSGSTTPYRKPVNDFLSASSSREASVRDSGRTPTTKQEQRPNVQKCTQCGESFYVGSQSSCLYHPGRKHMVVNGSGQRVSQYTCCQGGAYDPPCEEGTHVGPPTTGLDQLKRPFIDDSSPYQGGPGKSLRLR